MLLGNILNAQAGCKLTPTCFRDKTVSKNKKGINVPHLSDQTKQKLNYLSPFQTFYTMLHAPFSVLNLQTLLY